MIVPVLCNKLYAIASAAALYSGRGFTATAWGLQLWVDANIIRLLVEPVETAHPTRLNEYLDKRFFPILPQNNLSKLQSNLEKGS